MSLLHPYFIIAIVYMVFFSIQEVYGRKVETKWLWFLGIYLIILAGFRKNVGPDYGSYVGIYIYSDSKEYISILLAALSIKGGQAMELEWLFVFINKVLINFFNAPFYFLTLIVAALATFFKLRFIDDNTFYPFTFLALLFIPGFFVGECGQIRQNLGSFIVYFAIKYIKERKIWWYLLCIYLAGGIHNVCYLFLPMYWLARVPLNKFWMLALIITSIFLSPFEVYESFGGFLSSVAGDNVIAIGFNGYMDESYQRLNGSFGIPEAMMAIVTFFLFVFDKKMLEKYPYYEYHRNYAVIAICFYFIFKNNPIFSSRLAGTFMIFAYILIPNSMYVVDEKTKKLIHAFIMFLVVFYFIVFASFKNMKAGRFTDDLYKNHVLP